MIEMAKQSKIRSLLASALVPSLALVFLLAIGGYAVIGPTGMLAWTEYNTKYDKRQGELLALEKKRDALANRVELLDPDNVDSDLATELIREKLNVAHPDEIIVPLRK